MHRNRVTIMIGFIIAMTFLVCGQGFATQVPYENSNVKYFYVFGEDGDPLMGAEDNELELFIDVPANDPNNVVISIFDPNTGGKRDWKKPDEEWNTLTNFTVYGKELLDTAEFAERGYDGQLYHMGPYAKEKGEKIGNYYRFRLVVTGMEGTNQNLFKVIVSPNSADVFAENITFRLLPRQGDQMYFYPEVPAGVSSVVVRNYDLDVNGGTSTLSLGPLTKKYSVEGSRSGEWVETKIPISSSSKGKMVYIITKATQRYGNAGLEITDDKGNTLPLYFRKGEPPIARQAAPAPKLKPVKETGLKCNKFTFDATNSYDIDKQQLSYLWNFGDGETSTEPVVTHIYEKGGEYTVTLKVKDDSGLPCDSADTTQKIYVNTAPVAEFTAPGLVCVNDTVTLDASATTDDTPGKPTYKWNLGDGNRAEGKIVTHAYEKGGSYNITLNVDDNSGTTCSTDSIQKNIRVNTAPVAHAGRDITMCLKSLDDEYIVNLDGSGSKDADGDKLVYLWDLGDGTSGSGAKVTHTYTTSGVYKVSLTVDDETGLACSSDKDTITVDLNKVPVAVAGSDKKACTGETVTFDGSGSRTESGETLSYNWDFGDGEKSTDKTVSHSYDKGGTYTVVLIVDDGKETACSTDIDVLSVNVNSKPSVKLDEVKDTCVNKSISFDASGSRDPDGDRLDYLWNFGDGSQKEGASTISHAYTKGGIYNVSVTVDDGKDSSCSFSTDTIKVKVNTPPVAGMKIVKACCVDMEQKFDATTSMDPDGDLLTYSWDFGDGATSKGAQVSHIYTEPGVYKVVLIVDDGSGTECSNDVEIENVTVNAKPVAIIKVR